MGVSGLFKELGSGERISVAKLAVQHFITHRRPLRLAIDISIWLFQILASKGGSNPALRTFYYRLLRLLSLNIHPLFVFDGPNKPIFKRNKKVGGPGVRVASVPEFLAKELLRKFGFPWHVAPGEAEAECALLQRQGVVDAVLSEDVDTLMFGSGVLWRSWTAEGKGKVPTHCNVYRADEVKEKSGLDQEGMILVALMSGGDYIVEGISGCGPKVACDAARAGFGMELCDLARRRDVNGLQEWRQRLQHEITTNESKFFTRRNGKLTVPDDFPNREVLGYYTDPCVSTLDKVERLRTEIKWDMEMDFPALRAFTGDAFDWRCVGGAKKFIRNLAPAILSRVLRLVPASDMDLSTDARAEKEQEHVLAIHGKRNHATTDGELEYRITFVPQNLVPIDLSIEDEDDEYVSAGGADEGLEAEDEWAQIPSSTQDESDTPTSPTKKRTAKPYHPDQPEKIWMLREFLNVGCPLLVANYEDKSQDPKEFFKQRRKAKAAAKGDANAHAKKSRRKKNEPDPSQIPIDIFGTIQKSSQASTAEVSASQDREPLKSVATGANIRIKRTAKTAGKEPSLDSAASASVGSVRSRPLPRCTTNKADKHLPHECETDGEQTPKATKTGAQLQQTNDFFKQFAQPTQPGSQSTPPRRKRRSDDSASPAMSQRSIASYFTPSPRRPRSNAQDPNEVINLLSCSPAKPPRHARIGSPTPDRLERSSVGRGGDGLDDFVPVELPASVTRRRGKAPLKRAKTAPALGTDAEESELGAPKTTRPISADMRRLVGDGVEAMDLASPVPVRHAAPDPDLWNPTRRAKEADPVSPALAQSSKSSQARHLSTSLSSTGPRRSPRTSTSTTKITSISSIQAQLPAKVTKTRIVTRDSLAGAWKEVPAETLDLTGDGSGWKQSGGRAMIGASAIIMDAGGNGRGNSRGWRKSGVEVLDLTGA